MFKSGYCAIIGRANVGKSTLMNTLIGEKISIVSPKPQTTRDRIMGVLTEEEMQVVFLDTPGIHTPKNELSRYMMKTLDASVADVDCILALFDGTRDVSDGDIRLLERYVNTGVAVIAVVTKVDAVKKEKLFPRLARFNEVSGIESVVPLSARKGINLDVLKKEIMAVLPEGDLLYDEDTLTDKSERYIAAERVREKILLQYEEEIPHGIGISVNLFEYDEVKNLYKLDMDVVCEKQGHKAILIGKHGEKLKEVATAARIDLEEFFDAKVFLTLWVRVKDRWRDRESLVRQLGYFTEE